MYVKSTSSDGSFFRSSFARTLDIAEKDSLEIYVDGASIVLKKYQPACIFCDDAKDVINFKGKNVCPNCIRELMEK